MSGKDVTVIGAGIVGVSAAAWLQKRGFDVTIVDADPVGKGASFGNAGNVSPAAVVPYTLPGVLKELPGWLLNPEGPLAVRASALFEVLPWLLSAAKHSTTEAALKTSRAMRELHRGTFDAYDALTLGTDAAGLIERCGQLYVSEKPNAACGSQLAQFMREAAGVKVIKLEAHEIRDIEPTLAPVFKSGMFLPDNGRCKNPHQLVTAIARECERNGAKIVRGRVTDFATNGTRVNRIVIDGTTQPIERVVIAAGAPSGELTAKLGTRIPVTPERGYHITVEDPGIAPRVPVSNTDCKFVCAPMNMGLRLAGTAEFAGFDAPPNWKRATLLEKQAARMFPGVRLEKVSRWTGNRPSLPDGLPVLGTSPKYDNAYFAFGNGHFGITAGPVMGKYLATIVAGEKSDIDLTPFRPTRFN